MKIILFADNVVGMNIANYLVEQYPSDISMIVTVSENHISEFARKNNVQTCIFDTSENIASKFGSDIEFGVLAWWPKIIKQKLLDKPRQGFINTHPSLLPYNRGKHYNFWALVEQSPFGVTLHFVDSGIDTGAIIAQQEISYDWLDNGETLYNKAQFVMVELFTKVYPFLRKGSINPVPQNLSEGSFHHSSELELASRISLDQPYKARKLINLFRARTFNDYPGCWFEENNVRYEISIKIVKVLKKD